MPDSTCPPSPSSLASSDECPSPSSLASSDECPSPSTLASSDEWIVTPPSSNRSSVIIEDEKSLAAQYERRLAQAEARITVEYEKRLTAADAQIAEQSAALAAAEKRSVAQLAAVEAQATQLMVEVTCLRRSNAILRHEVKESEKEADELRNTLSLAYEEKDELKDELMDAVKLTAHTRKSGLETVHEDVETEFYHPTQEAPPRDSLAHSRLCKEAKRWRQWVQWYDIVNKELGLRNAEFAQHAARDDRVIADLRRQCQLLMTGHAPPEHVPEPPARLGRKLPISPLARVLDVHS